jgi:hypothetical protein
VNRRWRVIAGRRLVHVRGTPADADADRPRERTDAAVAESVDRIRRLFGG